MKKKIIALLLLLMLTLTGCQLTIETPAPVSGDGLIVHFIDVGQADAILLETAGEFLLIDGGNREDSDLMVSYLEQQGVEALSAVVCTHAHEDHVGGLPAVLAVYPTGAVYAPTKTYSSSIFDKFVYYTDQQGLDITIPAPGDTLTLGEAEITVLGPVKSYPDANNTSIVLKVVYGNTSFLFTGDMETEAENDMLDAGADVKADVLKVGHHGSNTSTGYRFLYEVEPHYAVISVGKDNTYGHPHKEPISRLNQAEVTTLRTDKLGAIVAVSDGNEITFTWGNQNAGPDNAEPAAPMVYIGNKNSKTFHSSDCGSLPAEKNRVEFATYEDAVAAGFQALRELPGMKKNLILGILAHVDAGKTTLSEALLYASGAKRTLGRVDHRDAALDTHDLERARGITIFSKQARLETENRAITLVDTPGHVDFSAEAERTLGVLDCAVLVISGTDGVQAHTVTLWNLLQRYRVPTFLFVSKMDLPGMEKEKLLSQLQSQLSSGCVDFGADFDAIAESAALCDEALLETYLETGTVTEGNLRGLIEKRKLFPVCFGSGLKLEGVAEFLDLLDRFGPERDYGPEFAARVYKISRDPQGARLTWLKVTGGRLKVRSLVTYTNEKGEDKEEKVQQLRLYSADKFTAQEEIPAGTVAAVTGLTETFAGQALGAEGNSLLPILEPVMTYRVNLPSGSDPAVVMPKLRQLEEEDPQLHLLWENGQIHVQIMGRVQLEIFRSLVSQRFGLDVTLDDRRIFYKETIETKVEGVGHFEPLRHYAECHLLLEPLPRGSGLVFDTVCPTDVLEINYQRLILTHLEEKIHRGVLTGAPITDMKITLLVGKAHLKHTEGGDFRQATYRAVRQGLMQAKSLLLEPWYDFVLTSPTEQIGRAITDIRTMGGEFDAPETGDGESTLRGLVPAAEVKDYADTVAAYTQGRGRLQLSLHGYAPCHNQEAVVAELGYDPESDLDNTPDSVFCAHGAGFTVKWNQVADYMHLESGLKEERAPRILTRNVRVDEKELERIMEREFGPIKTTLYRPTVRPATEEITIRAPRDKYIIVDGYNIIFAWEDLAAQAKDDLDAARRQLCDRLSSYAGFTKVKLVVVFDGYRQKGSVGEKSRLHNIQVVFTKEGETADAYIESLAYEIGNNYAVRVASSDGLVQLSSFRSGVLRMSARELKAEVDRAQEEMRKYF